MMNARLSSQLALIAKLSLAVVACVWLFRSGRMDLGLLAAIKSGWPWIIAAQGIFFASQVVAAYRWRLLLASQGVHYSLLESLRQITISWLFNQIVIGSTGGDVYRAVVVGRDVPERRSLGLAAVTVDRACGIITLLVLVAVAPLWYPGLLSQHPLIWWCWLLAVSLLAVCAPVTWLLSQAHSLSWVRRLENIPWGGWVTRLSEDLGAFLTRPGVLIQALGWSLVLQLMLVAMNWAFARALLLEDIFVRDFIVLVPLAHTAMAIPINPPGALGTAEVVYAFLFGLVGVAQGSLICVLQRLTYLLWALAGAIGFVWGRPVASGGASFEAGAPDVR